MAPLRRRRLAVLVALACSAAACSSSSSERSESAPAATAVTVDGAGPVSSGEGGGFQALNPAAGYGLLRVMTLEERPNPRDVVIYQALPNEMPRVAGVITTVAQTPLSHVNLRAVQDKVPNAYIADAVTDDRIAPLVGKYVRYEVTASGFTIAPAAVAEVEAHHEAARPTEAQVPERDLSVRAITPLSQIGFEDWTSFGVKAANLATLRTFDLPAEVPDGYAVPFAFYDEFMRTNGFYDRVEDLLDDAEFADDPETQNAELEKLRAAIEDAPMPPWMMAALAETQRSFPAGTAIRCRSSTNNEDLPNFSGAGLYDSKTQRPEEGHLSKCVKQVYASVWNLRAFLERDFNRIDHLVTAMGVLLHPNFDDELANGVAVSSDPIYGNTDAYYVNTQVGEDLVTNPDATSVPEELLLYTDGEDYLVTGSSRVAPGERVLTSAHSGALRESLGIIHQRFADQYGVGPNQRFAMEIEFKITKDQRLSIKQARTWLYT
jgi:hypothetical protein